MLYVSANSKSHPLFFNYDECKVYTRQHARSFYFSSFLLPKDKRNASYAVYTFCRFTDNLIDGESQCTQEEMNNRFSILYNYLDDVYSGSIVKTAFADTVVKFKIPKHYFTELIEGVMMDLTKKRYSTFIELDTYCYKVASVVGLMMSEIFGYSSKAALPYAAYLGKAMQLTNILRDVYEDYLMGRIYLPQDERNWFEYNEDHIQSRVINSNFIEMMKFNILRNKAFYEIASNGIPYLTNDGSRTSVVLMYKIYSGILSEIEKYNYDIYSQRRYVSIASKLRMTGKYFINFEERRKFSSIPSVNHHERVRELVPKI